MNSPVCLNVGIFARKPFRVLCWLLIFGSSVALCLHTALAEEIPLASLTITTAERYHTLVFSPDSKTLLTHSTAGKFRFWSTRSGALLKTINNPSKKRTLIGESLNGKILCRIVRDNSTTTAERDVRTYQLKDMSSLLLNWDHKVVIGEEHVALSPDRRLLAVPKSMFSSIDPNKGSSSDVGIELWDVGRGKLIRTLKPKPSQKYGSAPMGTSSLAFSFDNKILATTMGYMFLDRFSAESPGGYVELQLWDTQAGRQSPMIEEIRTKGPKEGILLTLASSPVGPLLAFEAGESGAKLCLANAQTGEVRVLEGHQGQITAVTFSPDGKQLASGSADTTVRLWDVTSGRTIQILRGHEKGIDFNALEFAPDGSTLASSDGNTVKLWRIK